jgi:polyisoprenoid-binding protein YceI
MQKFIALLIGCVGWNLSLAAAPQTFDFKDPKGVNNIVFKLDAPLESINGTAGGISGTVTFDPEKPEAVKGKIVLTAASLHVGNSMMKEHLQGDKWMDAAKYPEITFEASGLEHPVTADHQTSGNLTGTLTVKGVAKKVSVPVKLTYLKDKLSARLPQMKGDLLVVRSTFKIKRSDYGINPGTAEEKVSDEIELSLSLAGQSPR